MRNTILAVALLVLAGCTTQDSSSSDRGKLGTRYHQEEITQGLVFLRVETNWPGWDPMPTAQRAFEKRAREIVGAKTYVMIARVERLIRQNFYHTAYPRIYIAEIEAYLLTPEAGMTEDEARRFLANRFLPPPPIIETPILGTTPEKKTEGPN